MTVGLISTGAIIAILGYLVKYRRKEHWLSGYDASRVTDPKAVADFYGGHLLVMGLVGLIPGFVFLFVDSGKINQVYPIMGYVILIVVWILWMEMSGGRFYKKKDSLHEQTEKDEHPGDNED